MELLIIIVVTTSLSLFIKSRVLNLVRRDLAKEGIVYLKSNAELESFLDKRLIKIKDIHYLIPLSNIIVSLLYVFSYFLVRKEIINEIRNNNVIDFKPKELNNEDDRQTKEENTQVNTLEEQRNELLKLQEELKDLKGVSLKRKK